jgi:hypothetical protein
MVIWIFKELQVLVFQIFQNQTTMGSSCASLKQSLQTFALVASSRLRLRQIKSKNLKEPFGLLFDFFKHLRTVIMYIIGSVIF